MDLIKEELINGYNFNLLSWLYSITYILPDHVNCEYTVFWKENIIFIKFEQNMRSGALCLTDDTESRL